MHNLIKLSMFDRSNPENPHRKDEKKKGVVKIMKKLDELL